MKQKPLEMRMYDFDRKQSVEYLQLYLTPDEARWLRDELDGLLVDPEAVQHFHMTTDDGKRDLCCGIITPSKVSSARYADYELRLFTE